jgi:hypothetical protein
MQNLSFFPLLYVTTVDLLKQHQLAAQVLYVADVHLKRRKNRICYYLCMNLFIYFNYIYLQTAASELQIFGKKKDKYISHNNRTD